MLQGEKPRGAGWDWVHAESHCSSWDRMSPGNGKQISLYHLVTANIEIMLSVSSLVLEDFGFLLLVYSYTGSCVWLKYLSQCPNPGRARGSFELFHRWLCSRSCLGSER